MNPILFLALFVVSVYSALDPVSNESGQVVVDESLAKFKETYENRKNLRPYYKELVTIIDKIIENNDDFDKKAEELRTELKDLSPRDPLLDDKEKWIQLANSCDDLAKNTLVNDYSDAIKWIEDRVGIVKGITQKLHKKLMDDLRQNLKDFQDTIETASNLSKSVKILADPSKDIPEEQKNQLIKTKNESIKIMLEVEPKTSLREQWRKEYRFFGKLKENKQFD